MKEYLRDESSRAETYETVENTYLRYDSQVKVEQDLREANSTGNGAGCFLVDAPVRPLQICWNHWR